MKLKSTYTCREVTGFDKAEVELIYHIIVGYKELDEPGDLGELPPSLYDRMHGDTFCDLNEMFGEIEWMSTGEIMSGILSILCRHQSELHDGVR